MKELLATLDLDFILEFINTIMGIFRGLINAGEESHYGSEK